ncbi:MAG: epimerase [Cycloclasticus sp. symbiont of Bathymodiolus heckerae]|nr:MAG: epimerase [Cycloclasticus sp. symbiont of Bathymodiolus heckerae]
MISKQPICVTGGSGFIASHVIRELLAHGYRVRATVRGSIGHGQYGYLTALPGADQCLELVQAELLDDGAFDSIIAGCEYVIHMASPYLLDAKNVQHDLIDPAINGTLNVLNACKRSGSVKKVVLTSSVAALFDEPISGHTYNEDDWNTTSSLSRNPYYYAKTMAERAAWDFIEKESSSFKLVTINPAVVIGPSIVPSLNTSNKIFSDVLSGVYPFIMNMSWGFVDVRDIAKAHVLAMESDDANGRYVCTSEVLSMQQAVNILLENGYSHYKAPSLKLSGFIGDALVKVLVSAQAKGVRSFIRLHVGRDVAYDNSKVCQQLGISFRPVKQSILETVHDLIAWEHIDG